MIKHEDGKMVVDISEIFSIQLGLNQKYSKKVCELNGIESNGDWRQVSDFYKILSAADNEFFGELSDELKGHWNWFDPSKKDLVFSKNKEKALEEMADVICFITSVCLYSMSDDPENIKKVPGIVVSEETEFDWFTLHSAYSVARSGSMTDYRFFISTVFKMMGTEDVCQAYLNKVQKNNKRTTRIKDGVNVKDFE